MRTASPRFEVISTGWRSSFTCSINGKRFFLALARGYRHSPLLSDWYVIWYQCAAPRRTRRSSAHGSAGPAWTPRSCENPRLEALEVRCLRPRQLDAEAGLTFMREYIVLGREGGFALDRKALVIANESRSAPCAPVAPRAVSSSRLSGLVRRHRRPTARRRGETDPGRGPLLRQSRPTVGAGRGPRPRRGPKATRFLVPLGLDHDTVAGLRRKPGRNLQRRSSGGSRRNERPWSCRRAISRSLLSVRGGRKSRRILAWPWRPRRPWPSRLTSRRHFELPGTSASRYPGQQWSTVWTKFQRQWPRSATRR